MSCETSMCKITCFNKNTKTHRVLIVFGHQGKDEFKNIQKQKVFKGFILGDLGPSSPHLDRSRCDLGANAALLKKKYHAAAVCSFSWNRRCHRRENLVFCDCFDRLWKWAPLCSRLLVLLRLGAPRRTRPRRCVLEKLTTLAFQLSFAYFRYIALNVEFEPTETDTKPADQPLNVNV